jgi:116 kDa U5 small nuclear ribonucleoprotein component
MDGDDNYDEFGNYIGPDLDSDTSDDEDYSDPSRASGTGAAEQAAMELQNDDLDGPMMELAVTDPEAAASARAAYMATSSSNTINSNAIVLAEDKQYYPEASEVYGKDVETLVEEEDAQPLTKPIIAPIKKNVSSTVANDSSHETTYNSEFLASLLGHPQLTRNVSFIGHLHSGKTSVLDMLVEQTRVNHMEEWPLDEQKRYTDTRLDEQARGMSVKSCPISLVLPSSTGKSYLMNMMDCPGHVNFCAETTAGLRVSDGAIVVIDACEGVMMQTERVVREAVAHNVPICLIVNKIDRLITELKLPPTDAYYKIKHMINRLNDVISESYVGRMNLGKMKAHMMGENEKCDEREPILLDPAVGNVCFASTRDRWMFTLNSFAYRVYNKHGRIPKHINSHSKAQRARETTKERKQRESRVKSTIQETSHFAKRLWGDWYFNPKSNKITKRPPTATGSKRTFVQYILEPLWKLYGSILSSNTKDLQKHLEASLGIRFHHDELCIDPQPLLRLVLRRWMGEPCSILHSGASGFVDMCVQHVPSPVENARHKVRNIYRGLGDNDATLHALNNCDSNGPLMINVVKMYTMETGSNGNGSANGYSSSSNASSEADGFLTFGRVMSGTVTSGQKVRVLGEHYSENDDLEDIAMATVEQISISQGRHLVDVTAAPAGSWILLKGIDRSISYTATVCNEHPENQDNSSSVQSTFLPLEHATSATIRVSLEPRVPSELPKMVSALRMVCKSYPLLRSRVEESGEHVVLGTGEMHLDSALHDLRTLYTVDAISDEGIEIKLSDPVVSFCETVSESSNFQCTSETPNGKNKISMVAEPMERGLAEDVEAGIVGASRDEKEDQNLDPRRVSKYLRKQHGWDALAVRSIWSFGPDIRGPNVLLGKFLNKNLCHF